MLRVGAALMLVLAACAGPPRRAGGAPTTPTETAGDRLGSIRPRPYRKQHLVHIDDEAARLHRAGNPLGCAQAYIDRHNQAPGGPQADQLLFNAAECMAEARSLGAAITLRRQIVEQHPRSRFVPDAMLAMAQAYASIAFYREAADNFVRYATRFPAHDDAPQALATAARYQLALDDIDGAVAVADRFSAAYGNSLPGQAAQLHLATAAAFGRPEQRRQLVDRLTAYLRRFPGAPVAARVEARVRLGRALLQLSCPVEPTIGDACVVIERLPPPLRVRGQKPTTCGPSARTRWTLYDRDPALLARAGQELAAAQALWDAGHARIPVGERTGLDYWAAAGRFAAGELVLEEFLASRFPTDLDFSAKRRQASMVRLQQHVAARRAIGLRADKEYGRALGFGSAGLYWGVRVGARRADLRLRFAAAFMESPIPQELRTGPYADDQIDVYCDTLADTADPIQAKARAALHSCVSLASAAGWYDAWTRRCNDELSLLDPQEHPALEELYPAPVRDGIVVAGGRSRAELQAAVDADRKALGPHLAFGAALLREFRLAGDRDTAAQLAAEARRELSSALAVAPADVSARVLLALVYAGSGEDDSARLLLARLLLDEAEQIAPGSALVANARGVVQAARGELGAAASSFEDAIARDPQLADARINAGSAALSLRRWPEAAGHFRAALERAPDSYDARLGLGVALRAQGDLAGAERTYREALRVAPGRVEAPFDLGVLAMDFTASAGSDLRAALTAYRGAAGWFEQALAAPGVVGARRAALQGRLDRARKAAAQIEDFLRHVPPASP